MTMDSLKRYRYLRDEAAIKTIEAHAFRVSRLTELNDPFEWRVGCEGYDPELADQVIDSFVECASQDMGIICFSKEIKDPILWSHYTNIHRGMAFAVNSNLVPNLYEVDYDKPQIVIQIKHFLTMPESEQKKTIENLHKQKSPSWSFEQESRFVIELNLCKPSGGSYYWDKMQPNFITHAIIGFRSSINEQYLRRALDLNGFQHVEVLKAKRSLKNYEIELVPTTNSNPAV
jgi:hypothetical protein